MIRRRDKPVDRLLAVLILASSLVGCTAEPVDETHRGALAEGDAESGPHDSYTDDYAFDVAPGMEIAITMTSDDFDAYLVLVDGDDEILFEDDDSGGGLHAQITAVAPNGGTYRVRATSRTGGSTGAYALTLRTAAAAAR